MQPFRVSCNSSFSARISRFCSVAAAMVALSGSGGQGLRMNRKTLPRLIAATAPWMSASPVSRMRVVSGETFCACSSTATPVICGMRMSDTITQIGSSFSPSSRSASAGSVVVTTL
jgi:hypothetical protein